MKTSGQVIDQDVMWAALQDGRIARAALHALEQQPEDLTHPAYQDPRMIPGSHRVGVSVRALDEIFRAVTLRVIWVLDGHPPLRKCLVSGAICVGKAGTNQTGD